MNLKGALTTFGIFLLPRRPFLPLIVGVSLLEVLSVVEVLPTLEVSS